MTDERKQQLLNLALDSEPFDVHNHVKIVPWTTAGRRWRWRSTPRR